MSASDTPRTDAHITMNPMIDDADKACIPSIVKMVDFARQLERDLTSLRERLAAAEKDAARLTWAARNPEKAYRQISSDWANAGRGFRETNFSFRGCIDAAIGREGEK